MVLMRYGPTMMGESSANRSPAGRNSRVRDGVPASAVAPASNRAPLKTAWKKSIPANCVRCGSSQGHVTFRRPFTLEQTATPGWDFFQLQRRPEGRTSFREELNDIARIG